jgi:hypothetical protein
MRLSNGAMWSAVDRLGLSFKKRRSAPPNRIVRTSRRGVGSGARRSPSSMPISSFSIRATVSDAVRWTIDSARVKAEMGAAWWDARCRQTLVTTVAVKARTDATKLAA